MNERVRVTAKKPEAKRENKVSQRQKTGSSHSISSPVEQILFLQRTIGNQAVGRFIKSGALQAKLRIGQPGDIYEQEADRMAEQVVASQDKGQALSSRYEEKVLQSKTKNASDSEDTSVHDNFLKDLGYGQSLDKVSCAFFESHFDRDLSMVRVHTDARAADAARTVNARAFTVGKDVVFGDGEYALHNAQWQRLLAHELTHVIQQDGGNKPSQRGVQVISANSISSPALQRKENEDIKTVEWKAGVEMAEKAAKNPKTKG